ncbi:serine/threonine protein kinase [Anaeramoeba ignava]|uniref:non-specific serine/threonine protein kinase n=1 Tax=Anaeramoeba ignava TaxID=1746090 RepID=A0A9Q0RF06_ANAIG|nr:serine/threonine protein kinase [Anaeramoeba ignava]
MSKRGVLSKKAHEITENVNQKPELAYSKETEEKVMVCKQYVRQKYIEFLHYLWTRNARLDELKKQMDEDKLSPKQRKKKLEKYYLTETNYLRQRRKRLFVEDFQIIAKIGQGGYADVFLCRKKDTKELLALKRMKKELIYQTNQQIFFSRIEYLYLAMDYLRGGDLKTLLLNVKILEEDTAKFYAAEMLLCIEALHKLGFIHRDLKPENFLIDENGHIKLTDFGLSKNVALKQQWRDTIKNMKGKHGNMFVNSGQKRNHQTLRKLQQQKRSYSIVGSPDYISPEILEQKGYVGTVDFWSLGCILYEMLAGFPPFSGENDDETLANVLNFQYTLEYPQYDEGEEVMTDEAWDLIKKLLCAPEERLGRGSIDEIKNHSFFKEIEWDKLRESTPPFVPQVEDDADIVYFDTSYFEDSSIEVHTPKNDPKSFVLQSPKNEFSGFTFKKLSGTDKGIQEMFQITNQKFN